MYSIIGMFTILVRNLIILEELSVEILIFIEHEEICFLLKDPKCIVYIEWFMNANLIVVTIYS